MDLYHLSDINHDNETFVPRPVPKWRAMEGENWRRKRICMSTSIDGALTSLLSSDSEPFGKRLFVHVPEDIDILVSNNKIFTPPVSMLPDVEATDERWIRCPVKMKCIGEIEVMSIDRNSDVSYTYKGLELKLDKFIWKWIWKESSKNAAHCLKDSLT